MPSDSPRGLLAFLSPRRLMEWTEPGAQWTLLGIALAIGIGTVDWFTGHIVSFSMLYLAPAVLVSWRNGRRAGLLTVATTGVVLALVNFTVGRWRAEPQIVAWNELSHFAMIAIVALLTATMRGFFRHEHHIARADPLTDALNLRAFNEVLAIEIERSKRHALALTVVYLDIDNFKSVNDSGGHDSGDALLRAFVNLIRENCRPTDVVARVGGDEFVLLLPATDEAAAKAVVSKLRDKTMHMVRRRGWPVSLSCGVLTLRQVFPPPAEILKFADQLMYQVKNANKDGASFAVYSGQFGFAR